MRRHGIPYTWKVNHTEFEVMGYYLFAVCAFVGSMVLKPSAELCFILGAAAALLTVLFKLTAESEASKTQLLNQQMALREKLEDEIRGVGQRPKQERFARLREVTTEVLRDASLTAAEREDLLSALDRLHKLA